MNARTLRQLADATGGSLAGPDVPFAAVNTDTRTLRSKELFVALRGPHFDGHAFVGTAAERGAAGALVEHRCEVALPQVLVANTRRALGVYAACWREQFDVPVIGVTGSNGKTTVKEMLAAILGERAPVLVTRGNLNNDIGVPLTLLRFSAKAWAAVIELGTNHPGEIAYLTSLAAPTIGLVTNAATAHLEALGTVEGVAREKGALFTGLAADGIAVINADDQYADLWQKLAGARRRITFGLSPRADFHCSPGSTRALDDGSVQVFELVSPAGRAEIRVPLPGLHNLSNTLAACASAHAAGATLEEIAAGLSRVEGVSGRLQVTPGPEGVRIVDDTYNANPASVRAAVDFAVGLGAPVWLVLGDMGELGEEGPELHREVGEYARVRGVQKLFGLGPLSRAVVQAFGAGGRHFGEVESLQNTLAAELEPGLTLLVKGSRSMRMERIVQALQSAASSGAAGHGG